MLIQRNINFLKHINKSWINNSAFKNVHVQKLNFSTTTLSGDNLYKEIKNLNEFIHKKPSLTKNTIVQSNLKFNRLSSSNTSTPTSETKDSYKKSIKLVDNKELVLVKIGGGVIEDIDNLINSINFLKRIGLFPIVVHGGGPQLNAELASKGVPAEYVEGLRVTTAEVLAIAQRVFLRENLKIVEALEASGTKARPINQGVFQAVRLDKGDTNLYGFVGDVTDIHTDALASCISSDYVPVISSLAMSEYGQVLNINADVAALELAKAINPLKILFINTTAGMKDGDGKVMQHIKLDEQYDNLMKQAWVKHGTKLKLKEFKKCLDCLPPTTSITITSPELLQKELFSKTGSGTTVERGEVILTNKSPSFDTLKFKALLATVQPTVSYNQLKSDLDSGNMKLCVNSHYTTAILSRSDKNQLNVIEEFLVLDPSQPQSDAIASLLKSEPFIWKSKNSILNSWFKELSTGFNGDIYWANIDLPKVDQYLKNPGSLGAGNYFQNLQSSSSFVTTNKKDRYRVGLIGARGFTGGHLVRLIGNNPQMELAIASSSTNFGKPVTSEFPNLKSNLLFENVKPENIDLFTKDHNIDGWFFALPDKVSEPYVKTISSYTGDMPSIVDLSSDHRFNPQWTYGSPETNREQIKQSKFIANPGCYATGMYLSLKPFINDLACPPSCFGISGYSGAGSKPSDKNDPKRLSDNILPYKLVQHTHELEVSHQLNGQVPIYFMPHVGQFFQGITLTISMEFRNPITKEQIIDRYQKFYANEPLIKIDKDGIPEVKSNMNKHTVTIGGFAVNGNHLVVVTTLDNLLKGASTQALQNMNLTLGIPELNGISGEL
ncbi:acetylglutamate kinase [Tieghemostelium lacteum]|uniref:acetylglutamate kinase n=1 Tax=Tieghemostelium lacteum TaxID=361077 RepID=A0A151ZAH5_TIELA|nr:acetylglutamate kinase [Tieghemostelium lacteum]|eukprot:KYQ90947.1 acetylglutamate kinase [Tieghemostelium lacteum]